MFSINDMAQPNIQIPISKIDLFIDRVLAEKDETLHSLSQALLFKLERAPMISVAEVMIYPHVLQRIMERSKK